MSTPEFSDPPSNQRSLHLFEKFMLELDESQSGISRPHAHRAFYAGWSARFNAAMVRVSGKDSDEGEDMSIIRDYLKITGEASSKIFNKYFDYYLENTRLKKRIEDLYAVLRSRAIDPSDVPVWKRVSMQRKELSALLKHEDELRSTIKTKDDYISERDMTIAELKAEIKRLESK